MMRRSRIIAVLISLSLVLNVFTSIDIKAVVTEAPLNITRTVSPSGNIYAGEEVTITYTLTPGKIQAEVPNNKEIVIVMDKSGSMKWDLAGNKYNISTSNQRMTIARNAAKNFVESLRDEDNVKVAYVRYESSADLINDRSPFYSMGVDSSVNSLKTTIGKTYADGGTNIGDGMRLAYHALYNKGSADADKYIILLTDGEPTKYTAQETNSNYYYGTATSSSYYDVKSSDSKGLTYAKNWAAMYDDKTNPINGYFIAFSTNGANDLQSISNNATGSSYNIATTETSLNSIYSSISTEIAKYTPITDMYFEETFPEGVTIVEKPSGMIVNGLVANWDVPPLQYELNDAGTYYEADPVEFKIKIQVGESGDFDVTGGESFIKYTDLDGTTLRTKDFVGGNFEVHELNAPTINMSQNPSSSQKYFTLTHNGTGNMHFDGVDDYIEFGGTNTWHDALFGSNSNKWSVSAVINPKSLSGEYTNHRIENVFLAKASDSYNDNLELGINSVTNELMMYLDTDKVDTYTNVAGSYIDTNRSNDIVVSYDSGRVIVSVNGKETEVSTWASSDKMDNASGSPITLGASIHVNTYFKGKISSVKFYDEVVSRDDIYSGTAANPVANFNSEDITSRDQMPDSSGNGYSGVPMNGAFLQKPSTDTPTLEYKIVSDGTWVDYADTAVAAITTPGTETVQARAYINKSGSKLTGKEAEKSAEMEEGYIDSIEVLPNSTDIVKDGSVTVTYKINGSPVPISTLSATSNLGPIDVVVDVPSSMTPDVSSLPSGFTYNSGSGTVTGAVNSRMVKSGLLYDLEEISFDIKYKPDSTMNPSIPSNSVKATYDDYYGVQKSFEGGVGTNIIVRPNQPTIDEPFNSPGAGPNTIDRRTPFVFEGTADADSDPSTASDTDQTLVLQVTLLDASGNPTAHVKSVSAIVDETGKFVADPIDLSTFEGDILVEIIATDSPAHGGDSNSGSADGKITLIVLDFDIL